jgi:hypothetical protein
MSSIPRRIKRTQGHPRVAANVQLPAFLQITYFGGVPV